MYIFITLFGITFPFICTALGAALIFCFKNKISKRLNALFLGFASGVMIAASVWSLILPALRELENGWGRYAFIPVSIGISLGALFLWLTEILLRYLQKDTKRHSRNPISNNALKIFLAITLHNIPEGLAVGFAFGVAWGLKTPQSFIAASSLAFAIGIQNLPEGAAVALPMSKALRSRSKAFFYGMISGICECIFGVIGLFLATYLRSTQPWLLAFSAGAMLYVVVEELIPSANSVEDNAGGLMYKSACYTHAAWGATFGFILMLILDVALG